MGREIEIYAVGFEKDFPGWRAYQLKINQWDLGFLYLNENFYTFAWNWNLPLYVKNLNRIVPSLFAFLGFKHPTPKSGTISIIYDRLLMGEFEKKRRKKEVDETKDRSKLFRGNLKNEKKYNKCQYYLENIPAIFFLRYDMSSAPYCSFTMEIGKPFRKNDSNELTINMPRKYGVPEDLLNLILGTHEQADYIYKYYDEGAEIIYELNRLVKEA